MTGHGQRGNDHRPPNRTPYDRACLHARDLRSRARAARTTTTVRGRRKLRQSRRHRARVGSTIELESQFNNARVQCRSTHFLSERWTADEAFFPRNTDWHTNFSLVLWRPLAPPVAGSARRWAPRSRRPRPCARVRCRHRPVSDRKCRPSRSASWRTSCSEDSPCPRCTSAGTYLRRPPNRPGTFRRWERRRGPPSPAEAASCCYCCPHRRRRASRRRPSRRRCSPRPAG